jgi:endonuclease/exonuclease/phosphatase family metal-dependent hydrolase
MLRVVTWNMDHWRRSPDVRAEAWSYLEHELRPDIALLQETIPSGQPAERVTFRSSGIHDDRKSPARDLGWGSAVVSFGPTVRSRNSAKSPFHSEPIPLLRTFPGSVAIADVDCGDKGIVVAVSAYGLIDRGYADTTVHRILSDLTPLIDERRASAMLIAGDLNITTQWSERHSAFLRGRHEEHMRRDQIILDRFAVLGFENIAVRRESGPLPGCGCSAGDSCQHVQTQRHDRSTFPWQNDYVFVTRDIASTNPNVHVVDDEAAWRVSSHCPIVIELTT